MPNWAAKFIIVIIHLPMSKSNPHVAGNNNDQAISPDPIGRKSERSTDAAANRRQAIINDDIALTLFRLTLPMLYALVAIMGLGLVDSYFIAFLGTQELAAMGFIVPIAFTMTSVSLGLGMAISSLTSKLIGANRIESAARLITDGFYLTVVISVALCLLLAWQLETIFRWAGAEDETLPAIMAYMHTWLFGCVFLMLTQVCSSTFRAIGDTKTSARLSIALTLINLCLDPLLIFGYGPFPELGIQGAALATVIAVCSAVCIGFYQLGIKEKLLLIALPSWPKFKDNLSQLAHIALPAMLANAIVPVTAAVMTSLVAVYGAQAVAGFGVGGRIEAISLMVVYALSATLPMFIGQNLGANKTQRVSGAIKIAFKFVLVFQFVIYLVLAFFSASIATLFSDELAVQLVIKNFLWLVPLSYGFSGMVILINVSMNVLGKPRIALYINLARLFLIYLPLAILGSQLHEINGLLIGIAVGNLLAFALAIGLLKRTLREINIDF